MFESATLKAIWMPSWYGMDQSLAVGVEDRFYFYADHSSIKSDEEVDLMFLNQTNAEDDGQLRMAHVIEIYHKTLGSLARIDTNGLDYVFTTVDGTDVLVNAEEEPGNTYDTGLKVEDWSVVVSLTNVSKPTPDAV